MSQRAGISSASTKGTSSGCSTWTGWSLVSHTHTTDRLRSFTVTPFTSASVNLCECSGKQYGCIVRKKVMLLEEVKRDTAEFGGHGPTFSYCICVCLYTNFYIYCAYSLLSCVHVQAGGLGPCLESPECFPVITSVLWLLLTSWFCPPIAWSLGTGRDELLHQLPLP